MNEQKYECQWKQIAENERPITEGRLAECLKCLGDRKNCDYYYSKCLNSSNLYKSYVK